MVDKISSQNIITPVTKLRAYQAYGATQTSSTKETDEASFSPFARELSKIMSEFENVSDVRQDKIDDFKKQIAEGKYNPDPAKVAHSLYVAGILNVED